MLDLEPRRLDQLRELVEPERPLRELDDEPAMAQAEQAHQPGPRRVQDAADNRARVVGRDDQRATRGEDAGKLSQSGVRVEQVLEDLRAEHEVEGLVGKRQRLEVGAQELGLDACRGRRLLGNVEDPLREVDADDPLRTLRHLGERGQVPPVAAARVEEGLGRKLVEQELAQPLELAVEGRIGARRRRVEELRPPLVERAQHVRGPAV